MDKTKRALGQALLMVYHWINEDSSDISAEQLKQITDALTLAGLLPADPTFAPQPPTSAAYPLNAQIAAKLPIDRPCSACSSRYQAIIEADRTKVCEGVGLLKKILNHRDWLGEGRGPYEWDDDHWHDEFKATAKEIREAITGLEKLAGDLSNSPTKWEEIQNARTGAALERENKELRKAVAATRKWLLAKSITSGIYPIEKEILERAEALLEKGNQ